MDNEFVFIENLYLEGCGCKELECTRLQWVINQSNQIFVPMAITLLNDKGAVIGTLKFTRDADSSVVTDAVFSGITPTGFDNSIYTVSTDGSTNVTVTPVAGANGSQDLTVSANVAYLDKNKGQTTVNKSFTVTVTVASELALEATTLSIDFSSQA